MTINTTSARVIVASLATAALLTACGTNSETEDSNALALADQGSFAVGGTTTTAPGQFDPFRPAQPQGQTYLAIYDAANSRCFVATVMVGSPAPSDTTSAGDPCFRSRRLTGRAILVELH